MLYLSDHLAKGRISVDLVLEEADRKFVFNGEWLPLRVVVIGALNGGDNVDLSEHSDRISVGVEGEEAYKVEWKSSPKNASNSTIGRMRSVESLLSQTSHTSMGSNQSCSSSLQDRLWIGSPLLVSSQRLEVPLKVWIDVEDEVEQGDGLVSFVFCLYEHLTISVIDSLFFQGAAEKSAALPLFQPLRVVLGEVGTRQTQLPRLVTRLTCSLSLKNPLEVTMANKNTGKDFDFVQVTLTNRLDAWLDISSVSFDLMEVNGISLKLDPFAPPAFPVRLEPSETLQMIARISSDHCGHLSTRVSAVTASGSPVSLAFESADLIQINHARSTGRSGISFKSPRQGFLHSPFPLSIQTNSMSQSLTLRFPRKGDLLPLQATLTFAASAVTAEQVIMVLPLIRGHQGKLDVELCRGDQRVLEQVSLDIEIQ